MEFRTTSTHSETHAVTTTYTEHDTIEIAVTRLKLNGGQAKTIFRVVKADLKYLDVMSSIAKIVELDSEMFDMVAQHTKDNQDV